MQVQEKKYYIYFF